MGNKQPHPDNTVAANVAKLGDLLGTKKDQPIANPSSLAPFLKEPADKAVTQCKNVVVDSYSGQKGQVSIDFVMSTSRCKLFLQRLSDMQWVYAPFNF